MVKRTTVSIAADLFEAAQQRARALGYKSFSQYVAYLIEIDLRERGQHITVREESDKEWGDKGKMEKTAARAVISGPAMALAFAWWERMIWMKDYL